MTIQISKEKAGTSLTFFLILCWCTLALVTSHGCSTQMLQPAATAVAPPAIPEYIQVPHPDGLDHGDLLALFTAPNAVDPAKQQDCGKDFRKLRELTTSNEELTQGARELVKNNPVQMHWCFYSTLLNLETDLKNDTFIEDKQKHVLNAYLLLTPLARAFAVEFHDSRYLRWAIARYQRLSEYVFYRKVDITTETSRDLASSETQPGLYRVNNTQTVTAGVLEKYGITNQQINTTTHQSDRAD